jgi:hypothetical protein
MHRHLFLTFIDSLKIPISLKSRRPAKLRITHAKYDFLAQLPILEPLASRGRRLHETALQRQKPTYASDVFMQVEVVPADHKLQITYVEDERLVFLQGENKSERLWLTNAGTRPISEVWMITGANDELWVGSIESFEYCRACVLFFMTRLMHLISGNFKRSRGICQFTKAPRTTSFVTR